MAMGEAAGVAAALALDGGVPLRRVDVAQAAARGCAPRAPIPATGPSANATDRWRARRDDRRQRELPLAGIRVIDFTQVMMGPCRTQMLGRLRRRRDQDRAAGRRRPVAHARLPDDPAGLDDPVFCILNRNKRSIALDLREARARRAVLTT